jgi:hypothetical protein
MLIEQLLDIGKSYGAGTPQFNGIVGAIKNLNSVFKESATPEAPKTPLPVPATAPGAGPGGPPAPPGGAGGAPPIIPGME